MALAPAFVEGSAWFDDLELAVRPGVFVPSEWMLPTARLAAKHLPEDGTLLDFGCGVGTLGLWVAKRRPDAYVIGVDRNRLALELASDNAAALGLTLQTIHSDRLTCAGKVDLIINTLPYEGPHLYHGEPCDDGQPTDSYIADDSFAQSLLDAHEVTDRMAVYGFVGMERVFELTGWYVVDYTDDHKAGTRAFLVMPNA